ncbi:MAG: ABC transporter ATP-binding protein [Solirubrobacteraceae bacterium]
MACSGTVQLAGRSLRGLSAHRIGRLGCARTWQGTDLFEDLDVRENLEVAAGPAGVSEAAAETTLQRLGLGPVAAALPSELSEGQRKLVGVGRALAARPQLLCLDEPAAGLDTRESLALGEQLRALADAGQSTLLIDHDMGLVLGICDRVVVLEFGRVIADGPPEQVRGDPAVIAAYLGGERSAVKD